MHACTKTRQESASISKISSPEKPIKTTYAPENEITL